MKSLSFSPSSSDAINSLTRSATAASNLGPRKRPTANASVTPMGLSASLSIGLLSEMKRRRLKSRRFSSFLSISQSSTALRSASPSPLVSVASFGLTSLPSFASRSLARCFSERIISPTYLSSSPSGPGTSIGRTAWPLSRDCFILVFSDSTTLSRTNTAFASASPSGPRSSQSFGLNFPDWTRRTSESDRSFRNCTALRSSSDSGPASSVRDRSLGRMSSPSDSAIRRALLPSSSITDMSHWTADFSAFPSGPRASSEASIGLAYAGSSPIIAAIQASSCRSASFFLNRADLHL
mmetsp:Transcript_13010/g.30761  ORF Transcript_13010/g.30761 Transcript_13010/m.30761 type:complete len:295 (-) Transcript_13010:412-1296(-)